MLPPLMLITQLDRVCIPVAGPRIQAAAIEFGLEMAMPRTEEAIDRRNMQLPAG